MTPECRECEGPAELRKRKIATGYQVGWWCSRCTRWVLFEGRLFQPQAGMVLEDIESLEGGSAEKCHHCGEVGACEWHHYGPKLNFGPDDAERWPQGWLCRACHELWHEKMGQPIRKKAAA